MNISNLETIAEILSEFVDGVLAKYKKEIPIEKAAQIRNAVLDVFSERFAPSAPIQELQEEFRTVVGLKTCINKEIETAKKRIL